MAIWAPYLMRVADSASAPVSGSSMPIVTIFSSACAGTQAPSAAIAAIMPKPSTAPGRLQYGAFILSSHPFASDLHHRRWRFSPRIGAPCAIASWMTGDEHTAWVWKAQTVHSFSAVVNLQRRGRSRRSATGVARRLQTRLWQLWNMDNSFRLKPCLSRRMPTPRSPASPPHRRAGAGPHSLLPSRQSCEIEHGARRRGGGKPFHGERAPEAPAKREADQGPGAGEASLLQLARTGGGERARSPERAGRQPPPDIRAEYAPPPAIGPDLL